MMTTLALLSASTGILARRHHIPLTPLQHLVVGSLIVLVAAAVFAYHVYRLAHGERMTSGRWGRGGPRMSIPSMMFLEVFFLLIGLTEILYEYAHALSGSTAIGMLFAALCLSWVFRYVDGLRDHPESNGQRAEEPDRHTGRACRTCGYDLTGNISGVCPECGEVARTLSRGKGSQAERDHTS